MRVSFRINACCELHINDTTAKRVLIRSRVSQRLLSHPLVRGAMLSYLYPLSLQERTNLRSYKECFHHGLAKIHFPPSPCHGFSFSRREILRRKRENEWVPVFVSRVETNEACVTRKVRHRKNPKGALDTRDAIGVAIYILGWRMHKFGPLTRENFQLMVPFSFFFRRKVVKKTHAFLIASENSYVNNGKTCVA